jgi:broad-specificity NMP kinase
MGLIVIEGPDGSGKSTLAQRLRDECDRYMWFLRASTYPRDLLELQGAVDLLHYAKMMRFPTVTDRHPIISEMIYGHVRRGSPKLAVQRHQAPDLLPPSRRGPPAERFREPPAHWG